jgi:hypothetical protein
MLKEGIYVLLEEFQLFEKESTKKEKKENALFI